MYRYKLLLILISLIGLKSYAAESYTGIAAYGDDFVAVSITGRVDRITADGMVTTSVPVSTASLLCITSAEKNIYVGGEKGLILKSSDGITYTPMNSGVESAITTLACYKGKVVANGADGQLLVCEDGEDFVMADVSFVGQVTSLCASLSQCFGVTSAGEILSSKNGTDWSVMYFNNYYNGYYAPCSFTSVSIGTNRIAVVGLENHGKPVLYFSSNGKVWSERELNYETSQNDYLFLEDTPCHIDYQADQDQFIILCDNGTVMTVPPCSHCNKLLSVPVSHPKTSASKDGLTLLVGEEGVCVLK